MRTTISSETRWGERSTGLVMKNDLAPQKGSTDNVIGETSTFASIFSGRGLAGTFSIGSSIRRAETRACSSVRGQACMISNDSDVRGESGNFASSSPFRGQGRTFSRGCSVIEKTHTFFSVFSVRGETGACSSVSFVRGSESACDPATPPTEGKQALQWVFRRRDDRRVLEWLLQYQVAPACRGPLQVHHALE